MQSIRLSLQAVLAKHKCFERKNTLRLRFDSIEDTILRIVKSVSFVNSFFSLKFIKICDTYYP